MEPVVPRETLLGMHEKVGRLLKTEASAEAKSVLGVLSALLGNWPRVKRETWGKTLDRYLRLTDSNRPKARPASAKPVVTLEETPCELCLTPSRDLHVTPQGYNVCKLCAKQFWSTP